MLGSLFQLLLFILMYDFGAVKTIEICRGGDAVRSDVLGVQIISYFQIFWKLYG